MKLPSFDKWKQLAKNAKRTKKSYAEHQTDQEDAGELKFFKSQEFRDGMHHEIIKETWDKGLPMVFGRKTSDKYEVVARYSDGHEQVLSYASNGISYEMPNEKHDGIVGHWASLYAPGCYVEGDTEAEVRDLLIRREGEFREIQREYDEATKDDDEFEF